MNDFEIALKPKDVALNARNFVKAHKSELRQTMVAVYPYLIIFTALSLYFTYLMNTGDLEEQKLLASNKNLAHLFASVQKQHLDRLLNPVFYFSVVTNIAIAYCFAVIAIGWHRLVLLGSKNYEPMSFLNPQKCELEFVFLWTLIGTLLPFIPEFMIVGGGYVFFPVFFAFVLFPYLSFKISYYFPAKALNSEVTLFHSFKLTKGYLGKFFFAMFRVMWRISLVLLFCFLFVTMMGSVLSNIAFPKEDDFMRDVYAGFFTFPMNELMLVFIFQPLFTVLGVTVLSNYYQHAMRHNTEFYKQS